MTLIYNCQQRSNLKTTVQGASILNTLSSFYGLEQSNNQDAMSPYALWLSLLTLDLGEEQGSSELYALC